MNTNNNNEIIDERRNDVPARKQSDNNGTAAVSNAHVVVGSPSHERGFAELQRALCVISAMRRHRVTAWLMVFWSFVIRHSSFAREGEMNGAVHPVPFAQADAALAIAAIVLMIVGGFIGFVILWCWTQRELNDRWSPTKDDDLEMRETSALLITEVEPRSNPSPSMAAKRLRMDGVIITDEPRLTLRA